MASVERHEAIESADAAQKIGLHEAIAMSLELAYRERKICSTRELSLCITNLEQAAQWLVVEPSVHHLGENAFPDLLRQI